MAKKLDQVMRNTRKSPKGNANDWKKSINSACFEITIKQEKTDPKRGRTY
jgi:hypothetical protein